MKTFFLALTFTSSAFANQITPLSQCVEDVRDAAIRYKQVKRNPLMYLAVAGAGAAAAGSHAGGKWGVLTEAERTAGKQESDQQKWQQRAAELRKKLGAPVASTLPKVSADPKFQDVLNYLSKEFQLGYERRLLQAEMRGVAKNLLRDTKSLNRVDAEKARSVLTPKPGLDEDAYVKGVRTVYNSSASLEDLRDTYRKTRILEAALDQNVKDIETLRARPEAYTYRNQLMNMESVTHEYHRAMTAGTDQDKEKAKGLYEKTMTTALEAERARLSTPWWKNHKDVFDLMREVGTSKSGTIAGMAIGGVVGMTWNAEVAKAACGGDMSTSEATEVFPYLRASGASGCELSEVGAEALIAMSDEDTVKLCQQVPTLPTILMNAEMSLMNKLAALPKFTKVEPDCGTSTLSVEMANGHKYKFNVASVEGGNYQFTGTASGAVQRVIDFNGKLNGSTMEFSSLGSKQRFKGADMISERPDAYFNSYVNNVRVAQDSANEPKTLIGEGGNILKAFLPAFNARCGVGTSGGAGTGNGTPASSHH